MNTKQERADLSPCPFCGESKSLIVQHCEGTIIHLAYRIYCGNCGASSGYSDRVDPAKYWNRRDALQESLDKSQDREYVKRPVLDSIVDEIHRRADKEWADDGYDFEVTITADEYKALCEEEKSIDFALRIES